MNDKSIKDWVNRFHRDGYLVIPNVLSREQCWILIEEYRARLRKDKKRRKIQKRMFEDSPENLKLFNLEPVVSFARHLIGDDQEWDSHKSSAANAIHVFHNNSFMTGAGKSGLGKNSWHQDDTLHIFSTNGEPLPDHIRLNVMAFTVNYYLTDVESLENGPTQVIPGSHRFGLACPADISNYENKVVSCLGKAGTAVCFNNQVWHRGTENTSSQDRIITQVSYGKRLVGHKYGTFMNYQMPQHVYENADNELKELLGFLPHGPYG